MDKYTLNSGILKNFLRPIWRIEVDPAYHLMAVESRAVREGAFFITVMDYSSGYCFLDEQQLTLPDIHWVLAGIRSGIVVVRRMFPTSPLDAGICCFEAKTGELLWERYDLILDDLVGDWLGVRQRNWAFGQGSWVSIHDGQASEKFPPPNKPSVSDIVIPMVYLGNVPAVLHGYLWVGELWHAKCAANEVWAFHEDENGRYRIRMLITNGVGLVHDEIILSDLDKMLPEIFFIVGNRVFFVGDNKRDLISYLV